MIAFRWSIYVYDDRSSSTALSSHAHHALEIRTYGYGSFITQAHLCQSTTKRQQSPTKPPKSSQPSSAWDTSTESSQVRPPGKSQAAATPLTLFWSISLDQLQAGHCYRRATATHTKRSIAPSIRRFNRFKCRHRRISTDSSLEAL